MAIDIRELKMDPKHVRLVTREEVAHFRDHGWVKLNQLISPEFAGQLLERSKGWVANQVTDRKYGWWIDYYNPIEKDECFKSIGLSAEMGLNAQRLMRRSVGILLFSNLLAIKASSKQASTSGPSLWHQDGTDTPIDRSSWVRFWIALDRITPDMGSINFIDHSHRLGPLGNKHLKDPEPNKVLFDKFPELEEYGTVGPFEFQPGDATVHGMYTVHGAPSNNTSDPRWAFIVSYFADDTCYTGCSDEPRLLEKATKAGLARGDLFGGPLYPRVCEPMAI